MLTRLTAKLESVTGQTAVLVPGGLPAVAIEALVPAYVARALESQIGREVTLHTMLYLEGQGQGTSFIPRLVGFLGPRERDFFDLFTTVKGIGNRKALRALAEPPAVIAAAIARRDVKALTALPEIGKRMAETVIAELFGKVDGYLTDGLGAGLGRGGTIVEPALGTPRHAPAIEDAIAALCGLGESRPDAERKVARAMERSGPLETPDAIVAAVFATR
ncbi:MAG: Holliday junction branch migration protein RuvA [Phycisphaerales bacterium]